MPLKLMRMAEIALVRGRKARAARLLAIASAKVLRQQPQQSLPSWVVPGAKVLWFGEGWPQVYFVTRVERGEDGRSWWFEGEYSDDGYGFINHTKVFRQERGRRHWRRYVPKENRK